MGWFDIFRNKKSSTRSKASVFDQTETPVEATDPPVVDSVVESIPGWQTQFPSKRPDSPRRQFVIGLDFGTAYTKVVIGASTSEAYAVPFLEFAEGENPYLLPVALFLAEDGEARLGTGNTGRAYKNLKMRLLNGDMGDEMIYLIATFLALVLQHARGWFLNNHKDDYGQFELDWFVNVGLPTEQYHDDELQKYYRNIVKAAWIASLVSGRITKEMVENCFVDPDGSLRDDRLYLFPEFVGQINSYVKSPMRQRDMHLLVDVGAGTVDVAVFNVHQNELGDVFPIFAKSISNRGVGYLPNGKVKRKEFRKKLYEQIRADIYHVKEDVYPEFWQHGKVLPFILCGGGSYLGFYRDIADRMVTASSPCKLTKRDLPVPQYLVAKGLPPDSYHRMSVAYGLSFDPFDIGIIVRMSEQAEKERDQNSRVKKPCRYCNGTGAYKNCKHCGGSGLIG